MGYRIEPNNTYTLSAVCAAFNPLDATTYFLGNSVLLAPSTSGATRYIEIPYTGRLIGASIAIIETTSFGTSENSTLSFRLNNSTDTMLSSTIDVSAQFIDSVINLNTLVTAGDRFEIKWVTPTWVTNPVGTAFKIDLIFRAAI